MSVCYRAEDIMEKLNISQTSAYEIIRKLNAELEKKGYITVRGRVSKKYFAERCYCGEGVEDEKIHKTI